MSGVCCVRVREWGRKEGKPRWVTCSLVVEREEWIRIEILFGVFTTSQPLALFQPFLLRDKSCGICGVSDTPKSVDISFQWPELTLQDLLFGRFFCFWSAGNFRWRSIRDFNSLRIFPPKYPGFGFGFVGGLEKFWRE